MSTMMIATSAILLASAASSSHGGGSDCPISSFGEVCLIILCVLMALSIVTLILACTRHWASKWGDRWFLITLALWFSTFIPMLVGMIHDCQ